MPPDNSRGNAEFVAVEPDQIDRRQRALADFRLRQAERFEAELHVFQNRQPGKQRKTLEYHGDAVGRLVHRLAEIGDGAGRRLRQPGDQPQQSRFARTGAAEETDDLTFVERELDAVEHQQLAAVGAREGLAQFVNVEQSGHVRASSEPEFAFRIEVERTPEHAIDDDHEQAHHGDAEHDAVKIAGVGLLRNIRTEPEGLQMFLAP